MPVHPADCTTSCTTCESVIVIIITLVSKAVGLSVVGRVPDEAAVTADMIRRTRYGKLRIKTHVITVSVFIIKISDT